MTNTKTLTAADLYQFTGSENWYRHALNRKVLYTDGAQYLAEQGGAYWLLDTIAIAQAHIKAVAAEEFQVWTLTVNPDHTALLICGDGNNRVVHTQSLPFTDFPLPEVKLYFCNNVILLPSEY
ncbi:MAG: hypothetical protein OEY94_08955 [Alphaproteobacteria bacterium]|nr:hypothetical protein [Alphaproteobacteria bacterium]